MATISSSINTGSTLTLPNGQNKTSTALSTNILIMVGNTPVGAIQSLSIDETRSIKPIVELGTDGTVDSAPDKSVTYTVSADRIRFDKMRGSQAFGRSFIHAGSQRYPFDIHVIDQQSEDQSNWVTTILKNCWINKIGYSYSATDWIITDKIGFNVEFIYSFLGNGSPVGDLITPRNIPTFVDPGGYEKAADIGARRGALDAPGLIDLVGDLF